MNGGYIMIYKSSKKIYSELFACLTLGKPILWYEDKNTCFFIDTISGGEITTEIVDDEEVTTYGDIILTKGGMTITITSENVVTEVGDIQPTSGSSVVANPTLVGDEDDLTGLEVDGVKYAVSSGGDALYEHFMMMNFPSPYGTFALKLITKDATPFTKDTLRAYLISKGIDSSHTIPIWQLKTADATTYYNIRGLGTTTSNITIMVTPVGSSQYTTANLSSLNDTIIPV